MKATDIKDIEAMTGAKVVAATKETSSFNSDFVLLADNGTIRQAFTVRDINGKMCIIPPMYEHDTIKSALSYLNMSDEELAQNIEYINPENNTPTTMNANETTAPEFSELSHAAQCLDIYLHNTREIYERYTVPAIKEAARRMKLHGVNIPANVAIDYTITGDAMDAARALVVKYDHLHPTAADCTAVFSGYDAYIMESATFEVENA